MNLSRIARIRENPDYEVTACQDTLLRQPNECGVVGLTASVGQLDPHPTDSAHERIVVDFVGTAMPLRKGVAWLVELTPHDDAVQRLRRVIPIEPIQHVAMGDDARARMPLASASWSSSLAPHVWSMCPWV